MFIYLSKKIAIPNGVNLHCLSWNPDQGWIACGGDTGLLKVLKLELTGGAGDSRSQQGVAAPSNLSMNQTLDGHHGRVMCVTWNALHRKLTTSDETGLIIVWMLHQGMWYEEMINNRNRSVVRDMKWTANGSKICIVYEDGAVIVGSVDGNRLWGRELEMQLTFVEWSPDARTILFVSWDRVYAYDAQGVRVKELALPAVADMDQDGGKDEDEAGGKSSGTQVAGIHWYDGVEGQADPHAPTLAIAFRNGRVQISRGTDDPDPVVLDTKLKPLTQCKWNTRGSVLAIAGTRRAPGGRGEGRDMTVVQFYDPNGTYLRTLKVPGSGINSLSWEGGGLRIALAVDAYIYFANIRPDYKWGYLKDTLVYAYTRPERTDSTVVFWDMTSGETHSMNVAALRHIKAAGTHCVLISGPDQTTGKYKVSLCNSIGSPIETKYISIRPVHVAMTPLHVAIADDRVVYIWQYKTQVLKLTSADQARAAELNQVRRTSGRERMLDVNADTETPASTLETFTYPSDPTQDRITAITASDKNLIVGRESGQLKRYTLPHISLEQTNVVRCRPQLLRLNCDSSRLAIVDTNGILTIMDLDALGEDPQRPGKLLRLERKDAWDICWASDNPRMFAVMEKTRMYVFNDLDAQEPYLSSGYLAGFGDMMIKAVMLDDLMNNPEKPTLDMVVDFETKSLREIRDLIETSGRAEAYASIEQHPHPRLWRLLAESSLNVLDFGFAEKAFVRCRDFKGIQFVKRLQSIGDKNKQRAEVATYFGRFEEAEAIYRDIDRNDLAVDMRLKIGDWFRVISLIQKGGGDDKLMSDAMTRIGEFYAERYAWDKAAQYFSQAKQYEKMAECYYRVEDFRALHKLVQLVPQGSTTLLLDLARKFESVGVCESAVDCYIRAGEVRGAIDCCVLLNDWKRAVELAEKHDFPQIEGLLSKHVRVLLEQGDKLRAVELYRKANKGLEAAKLLASIAEEVSRDQADPLRAKKLLVLAAFEIERFRKAAVDRTLTAVDGDIAQATAKTLDTLMTMDQTAEDLGSGGSKVLAGSAWRGAAAYHYYLLAQRQLYGGRMDAAMKTSIRLAEYEDILDPRDIYSLIALTAYHSNYFGICSRAFIKLETLPPSPERGSEFAEQIQNLALQIFTKNSPLDPQPLPRQYMECLETGTPYRACTASGQLVLEGEKVCIECRSCRHFVLKREAQNMRNCPLCHSRLE